MTHDLKSANSGRCALKSDRGRAAHIEATEIPGGVISPPDFSRDEQANRPAVTSLNARSLNQSRSTRLDH
jgi:hypothetical protein